MIGNFLYLEVYLKTKIKITKLVSGPYDNGSTIHQEGHPLNSFYMYKTDGLLLESVLQTDADGA